jgi:hypothetical protein
MILLTILIGLNVLLQWLSFCVLKALWQSIDNANYLDFERFMTGDEATRKDIEMWEKEEGLHGKT